MNAFFEPLPLSAQTSFAELQEQVQARLLRRTVSRLTGSFARKKIRDREYWYWQARDLTGKNTQVYLGPDNDRLRHLIEECEAGRDGEDEKSIARLVATCRRMGCQAALPQHGRVIGRLEEDGFFRAGGVLIGTHAFIAMSNMLGVRWREGFLTQDIDFAHAGTNVSLALPTNVEAHVHDAITSLEMGLQPQRSIVSGEGATYLTRSGDLRVELLTPQGRSEAVFRHEALGVNLQPLKFMAYALVDTTQTIILYGETAVLVNIPEPMRYAMHKLLVMSERETQFQTKINKDAAQVAALVSWGLDHSPHALAAAAEDIMGRGKGWRTRTRAGLLRFSALHPELGDRLAAVLDDA